MDESADPVKMVSFRMKDSRRRKFYAYLTLEGESAQDWLNEKAEEYIAQREGTVASTHVDKPARKQKQAKVASIVSPLAETDELFDENEVQTPPEPDTPPEPKKPHAIAGPVIVAPAPRQERPLYRITKGEQAGKKRDRIEEEAAEYATVAGR